MNNLIIQSILGILISSIIFYFFNKPKKIYVIDHDYGWLDIKKYPIPDDDFFMYIATDGEIVKDCFGIFFDSDGDVILSSFKKEKIMYWMPYPMPPKKGNK